MHFIVRDAFDLRKTAGPRSQVGEMLDDVGRARFPVANRYHRTIEVDVSMDMLTGGWRDEWRSGRHQMPRPPGSVAVDAGNLLRADAA